MFSDESSSDVQSQTSSSSSENSDQPSKRFRRRSRNLSIEITTTTASIVFSDDDDSFQGYSSAGEETIYSEQGYETVAIDIIAEDDSNEDSDVAERSDDDIGTEYEVDSDAYREEEAERDGNGDSSSDDSDFQVFPSLFFSLTNFL